MRTSVTLIQIMSISAVPEPKLSWLC